MFFSCQDNEKESFSIQKASLSSFLLSTIDVFKVSLDKNVITFIQSPNLVYLIFNFDMFSLLIKTAIPVNRDVLDGIILPKLGFDIAKVLELIVKQIRLKLQKKIILLSS